MQGLPPDALEVPARWMRRLGRDEFRRLMGASIEAALAAEVPEPRTARRLRQDALRRFAVLLAARTQRIRALTRADVVKELERNHKSLLRQRTVQDGELVVLESALAQARGTASAAVLTEGEEQALQRALRADLEGMLTSSDGRRQVEIVLERERERRAAALARVVARERERIDQLERRIAKLRQAQTRMEEELVELARRAELDPGLPSIYRTVQGLGREEAEREAKSKLLSQIFEQNLVIQGKRA